MLTWLVRRRVVATFAAVGRGDVAAVLPGLAPDVEHVFAGDHPLGGTRHSRAAVEDWFGRLHRLFPGLVFDVRTVAVAGPLWDLRVTAEWVAAVTPAAGPAYTNHGVHVLRIRRGRVSELHAYEDSQAVASACAAMAALGIAEATAPAITG